MKKALLIAVLTFVSLNFLTACNTIQGAGKDIQRAGKAIDKAASKNNNNK